MSKFLVDCGHTLSGGDTGAEGCGKLEQNLTREVGCKVIAKLQALGHTVVNCTVDYASTLSESLAARVNKANNAGGDLYVCIHFNASNGAGHGTEVFTYNGKELTQARNVLNNICALGYTNRGIKSANLYVINHTNMNAMLIECCFIDNDSDMSKYNAENLANAIVKGVTGTTTNVTTDNTTTTTSTTPSNYNAHLKDWQNAYNKVYNASIYVDGIYGSQTEQAFKKAIVKKGNSNLLVGWLQIRIGASPDNIFGDITDSKLRTFQSQNGLDPDGVAGFNTWKKLIELFK